MNAIWSYWMMAVIAFWAIGYCLENGFSVSRAMVLGLAVGYILVSYEARLKKKWAVLSVLLVTLVLFVRWVPMVSINFLMFFAGHELYWDSPATIFVVIPLALVFAMPAVIVAVGVLVRWKEFKGYLQGGGYA